MKCFSMETKRFVGYNQNRRRNTPPGLLQERHCRHKTINATRKNNDMQNIHSHNPSEKYVWNTDRVWVSTRAIPCHHVPERRIGTVLPDVRTSTRSVFHLLNTPPYLPAAERAIHCVLPTQSTKVDWAGMHTEIRTTLLGRSFAGS